MVCESGVAISSHVFSWHPVLSPPWQVFQPAIACLSVVPSPAWNIHEHGTCFIHLCILSFQCEPWPTTEAQFTVVKCWDKQMSTCEEECVQAQTSHWRNPKSPLLCQQPKSSWHVAPSLPPQKKCQPCTTLVPRDTPEFLFMV